MLKRLTPKLFTLAVLCVALVTLTSGSPRSNAFANSGFYCVRAIDEDGNCANVCCDDVGCWIMPC